MNTPDTYLQFAGMVFGHLLKTQSCLAQHTLIDNYKD